MNADPTPLVRGHDVEPRGHGTKLRRAGFHGPSGER